MLNLLKNLWDTIVNCYLLYSGFIHSILPGAIGDLIEGLLDIAIVCLIIKIIASYAFHSKTNEI